MAAIQTSAEQDNRWPRWWRLVVVGVSTLILCSCRAAGPASLPDVAAVPHETGDIHSPAMIAHHPGAPAPAMLAPGLQPHGAMPLPLVTPVADPAVHAAAAQSLPYPEQVITAPEPAIVGLPQPGPECIFDGGDRDLKARVLPDWTVQGLEPEDTIGHADTLDGSVIVAPSNRVKIYAPRFAAVRSVTDLQQGRHVDAVVLHDQDVGPRPLGESLRLDTHRQNIEARGQAGDRRMQGMASQARPIADAAARYVLAFDNGFLPYEDFSLIRRGIFENTDKPRLAAGKQAANTWSHDLGVQVTLDGRQAATVDAEQRAQAILLFEDKTGPARLRVIKVASTSAAAVGEVIDFTVRYDNVGDQTIGNVTIIDNLTPRLEYVPDSAQSSRAANFLTQANDGGSLILRWEIIDPLPKGEGGLVRFKCRVR